MNVIGNNIEEAQRTEKTDVSTFLDLEEIFLAAIGKDSPFHFYSNNEYSNT